MAVTAETHPSRGRVPRLRLACATPEERVFGSALGVCAVHALVAGRPVAALLAPALLAAYLRRGRIVRTLIAAGLGVVATFLGIAVYFGRVVLSGAFAAGVTGTAFAFAGLALLGLALRIAFRGRCRRVQVLAVLPVAVVLQWVVAPAVVAGLVSNAPHPEIAPAASLGLPGARDVAFTTSDGVRIFGWYVPGLNGAAVVLLHGSHGNRSGTLDHLRLAADAGFSVLAIDARGHGASGGRTNAVGWNSVPDVAAAVAFLRRSGVDGRRIGMIGLSMGGEVALRAAAAGVPLRAVVADGAGAATAGDDRVLESDGVLTPVARSTGWLARRAVERISGAREPAPLKDVVARIEVPVLLVASSAPGERTIDALFRRRIGPRATLWYVPDAGHTGALERHPRAYRDRVVGFLGAALAPRPRAGARILRP